MKKTLTPLCLTLFTLAGCATVEPGHLGLMFKGLGGGLQRQKLEPGTYYVPPYARVEDFDITYSTRKEKVETTSSEGLHLTLHLALIYRPVVSELFDLYADIGTNYYDEVIGPEFRSAARGVFAHHSYLELLQKNEQIEDELETALRRRTTGKHIEVSSVTLEGLEYAPEISRAIQEKLTAEQDASRQKTLLANEDVRQKTVLANEDLRRRTQIANEAEQAKIKAETVLREKQQETALAKEQASLDKLREESEATKRIIRAKSETEEAKFLAIAKGEQARAANQALTPLSVMQHGYDALQALGGTDAHIYLGDWSKVPSFLLAPQFQNQVGGGGSPKSGASP